MLLDAFRAEFYRLFKNRVLIFWTLGFVPLILTIGGIAVAWHFTSKMKSMQPDLADSAPIAGSDLASPIISLAGHVSNIGTLAFLLIGAATLFACDYRWETWRLISARNSRPNLLGGKLLVLALMIVIAAVALLVAGLIILLAANGFEGKSVNLAFTGAQLGELTSLIALGVARLLQVLLLALVAAVLTRSLMATLFVPIVISIAQSFTQQALFFLQIPPTDWRAIFISPGLAVDHLKGAIQGGLPPAMGDSLTNLSLGSLALWIVLPLVVAFALFQRQGMSKE